MKRVLILLGLAGLAGGWLVIRETGSGAAGTGAAAQAERPAVAAPATPTEGSPSLSATAFWQQNMLDAIARLKLDANRTGVDEVLAALVAQNPSLVAEVLRQVGDAEMQGYLLNRVAIAWGQKNPAQTAAWVQGLPDTMERTLALMSVGRIWAETNPEQAADYAAQLPPGPLRQQVLSATLSGWIQQDVLGAGNWINQRDPGPELDAAAVEIAHHPEVMNGNPAAALSWAESITNENQRQQSIGIILRALAEYNRPAAIQYAQNTPALSPEQRQELIVDLGFDH